MSNTIRSVIFSSPFDFNHRLNRMRYLGAVILLIFVRGIINVAAYKSGSGELQVLATLLLMPLLLIDCKLTFARFSEFVSNKNIIVTLLIIMFGPYIWFESVASVRWSFNPEGYSKVAAITMALALFVSFISLVALLFTPADKNEETVVVA